MSISEVVKGSDNIKLKVKGFRGELKDFQRKGVAWLLVTKRGLLADQCGLGKTIQSICMLQHLKDRGELGPTLIVVLASATKQWEKEIKKFTKLRVANVSGKTKGERMGLYSAGWWDVLIVNYELLWRDHDIIDEIELWHMIVDEISFIKNHRTKSAEILKNIADRCERVIGLSATPIQNNLLDIHSIMECIEPSLLPNVFRFKKTFCDIKYVPIYTKRGVVRKEVIQGYKHLDTFKNIIEPFVLRRRLSEVDSELPDIVSENRFLTLGKRQKELYKKLRDDTLVLGKAGERKKVTENIHNLQRIVDGIGYLEGEQDESCKLDYIMDLLSGDLRGEKVVIFSRYKSTLQDLKKRFKAIGVRFIELSGDVPASQRKIYCEEFSNDPRCNACLGTQAMEMSLNLQAARFMILINNLFNPTRMEQVVGRIRRIGSEHKTIGVINLMTEGTMEKKYYDLLLKKQNLPDFIFDETSDLYSSLTTEQILEILQ